MPNVEKLEGFIKYLFVCYYGQKIYTHIAQKRDKLN